MNGLGEGQILETRTKAVAELERRGYEVVDTYFKDGLAVPHKVVNEPLYYLSQSLAKMACCDAVFLCEGWENARGCRVERAAAVAYDLEIIGHDIPCTGGARRAWSSTNHPAGGTFRPAASRETRTRRGTRRSRSHAASAGGSSQPTATTACAALSLRGYSQRGACGQEHGRRGQQGRRLGARPSEGRG